MLALVIAVAAGAGVLTVLQPGAAAAVAAALVLVAVLLSTRSRFGSVELEGKRFRWLSLAWAFVLLEPIGHFTAGRTSLSAVAGNPSAENVVELACYALIAALSLWSLKRNRFGRRPAMLILALPVLSLLSASWSLAVTVTLGFSFELLAMVFLATVTQAILEVDHQLGRSVIWRALRLWVQGVVALCVVGLIFRSGWTLEGEVPRFTWPGTHPLVASAEVGAALLILAFVRRDKIGFSWRSRAPMIVLFGVCLFLGQARTALAGLAVAIPFGYWISSRGSGSLRRLAGAAVIVAVVAVVIISFGGALTGYLARGQSQQQVFGLNGRLGLWTLALQSLHGSGRWLVGYGLSGSRVLLATSVAWAGDAHSAWVELLLSLGLLGATIGVTLVVVLTIRLIRQGQHGLLRSPVLAILFVYLLAMSPAATGFAVPGPEPGLGFALLSLCYAATAAPVRSVARAVTARHRRVEPRPLPVPV